MASVNIVGVTMIAATIVAPPVTARLLTDRFNHMLPLSAGTGSLTGFFGLHAGDQLDIASGASIVLHGAGIFVLTVAGASLRRRASYALTAPERSSTRARERFD